MPANSKLLSINSARSLADIHSPIQNDLLNALPTDVQLRIFPYLDMVGVGSSSLLGRTIFSICIHMIQTGS